MINIHYTFIRSGLRKTFAIEQAPRCDECRGAAAQGAAAADARGTARRAARAGGGGGRGAGGAHHLLPGVSPQPPHHAPRPQPDGHASRHETLPYAFLSHLSYYIPLANDLRTSYLLYRTSKGMLMYIKKKPKAK